VSGCTARTADGLDCLNHADREWVNSEGNEMRLCGTHDAQLYRRAIAAAHMDADYLDAEPFHEAMREWTG
jgi:hypothetical protein